MVILVTISLFTLFVLSPLKLSRTSYGSLIHIPSPSITILFSPALLLSSRNVTALSIMQLWFRSYIPWVIHCQIEQSVCGVEKDDGSIEMNWCGSKTHRI